MRKQKETFRDFNAGDWALYSGCRGWGVNAPPIIRIVQCELMIENKPWKWEVHLIAHAGGLEAHFLYASEGEGAFYRYEKVKGVSRYILGSVLNEMPISEDELVEQGFQAVTTYAIPVDVGGDAGTA